MSMRRLYPINYNDEMARAAVAHKTYWLATSPAIINLNYTQAYDMNFHEIDVSSYISANTVALIIGYNLLLAAFTDANSNHQWIVTKDTGPGPNLYVAFIDYNAGHRVNAHLYGQLIVPVNSAGKFWYLIPRSGTPSAYNCLMLFYLYGYWE